MSDFLDYGVCRLAVVPVRKHPSHSAEQINQLLFGDHYQVIETTPDKSWMLTRSYFDGVEGWIDVLQHHAITHEYFEQINVTDFKITTELTSWILYKKSPLSIVMGSIVPISVFELFKVEEQFTFNVESIYLDTRIDYELM